MINAELVKKVKGRIIGQCLVTDDSARLQLEGDVVLRLSLDGECCSSSYFTNLEQFRELEGSRILALEERAEAASFVPYALEKTEVLSWHFLVFTTDRGHVTIDWRNDSNGYYDGTITAVLE